MLGLCLDRGFKGQTTDGEQRGTHTHILYPLADELHEVKDMVAKMIKGSREHVMNLKWNAIWLTSLTWGGRARPGRPP